MNPLAWMRLLALVSLLAAPACLVDPVDFTGKTCTSASDCPDGYRCEPASGTCVATGSSSLDGSLSPRDGSLPGDAALARDAAVEPGDAEIVEPADADLVEPGDAGKRADASTPAGDTGVQTSDASTASDGGPKGDATVVQPPDAAVPQPDAGSECKLDSDCKALGAYYCGAGGVCLPCNTDLKCGASCSSCGLGASCDGTACQPCNTDLKCGLACTQCAPGTACNGVSCQPCTTADKCGPTCATCPAGAYCGPVGGQYSCLSCDTPQHCGASCAACGKELPACNGTACVECSAAVPCSSGFCVNDRCVQCREDLDCPSGPGLGGQWCDKSTGTCQPCNDAQHCGAACSACASPLRFCSGSACVECLTDLDCVGSPSGSTCCKNRCIANEVPRLAGFSPLTAAPKTTLEVTLYGTGFNECSVVELNGVPMPVSWLGAGTKLGATVTTPAELGPTPLVVRNPGLGGGVSGPNSAVLGSDFPLNSIAAGVAYVPGADLVAFAGTNAPYRIQTLDPASFTVGASKLLSIAPVFLAAGSNVVLITDNQYNLRAFGQFPTGPETLIPAFGQAGQIDVDDASRLAVVGFDSPDGYDLVDLDTLTRSASISFNAGLCCEQVGVSFDGFYAYSPFVAWNNQGAGFAPSSTGGTFKRLYNSQVRRRPIADRKAHRILMLDENFTLHEYDIKAQSQVSTTPVLFTGELELVDYPWGERVLIATPSAGAGLYLTEWTSRTLLGGVGTGRSRGCSGADKGVGDPDGITVDSTRNRAFIANSCSKAIEGWNLNLLFVK